MHVGFTVIQLHQSNQCCPLAKTRKNTGSISEWSPFTTAIGTQRKSLMKNGGDRNLRRTSQFGSLASYQGF